MREECQKIGIPYTPPERKFDDDISVTSAPPNKRNANNSSILN